MRSFHLIALAILPGTLLSQWQPHNLDIADVVSVTSKNTNLYVVGYYGLYRSVDGGTVWEPLMNGLPVTTNAIRSIGNAGGWLFAGTTAGVYRLTLSEDMWQLANDGLEASLNVYATRFYRAGTHTFAVLRGTILNGGGIFRSTNIGASWLVAHAGLNATMSITDLASNGTTLYAATTQGVFKSTNWGDYWTQLPNEDGPVVNVELIGNTLHILTNSGYRRTSNEGVLWQGCSSPPTNSSVGDLIEFSGQLFGTTTPAGDCVFRSLDNGQSCETFNEGIETPDLLTPMMFNATAIALYLAAGTDLYSIGAISLGAQGVDPADHPLPYPTVFSEGFHMDITATTMDQEIVLCDGLGRVVRRLAPLRSGRQWFARESLAPGMYDLVLVDHSNGIRRSMSRVIAE